MDPSKHDKARQSLSPSVLFFLRPIHAQEEEEDRLPGFAGRTRNEKANSAKPNVKIYAMH